MYMYYLLGYRIVKECQTVVLNALETQDPTKLAVWGDRLNKATGITGKSEIFQMLDEEVLFRVCNFIFTVKSLIVNFKSLVRLS